MTNFYCLNNFHSYKIFGEQKVILYFMQLVIWTKKLCGRLVRDKNIGFCHVSCLHFVMSLQQFYKSNTILLKLFCHVIFFAYQTL